MTPALRRPAGRLNLANPAWAMLEYGWYPLLLLIATPWFLHRLGAGQYGHWMLLLAVVGFGGVLNTGTGAATIKSVSAGIGGAPSTDIERTVRASLTIALAGGISLALIVFGVFWIWGEALFGRMGEPEQVRLTGLTAAALVALEQVDNVYSSALKGAEKFSRIAAIEVLSKSVQVIVAAMVLVIWPALIALYISLLAVAVLRLIAKTIVAKRLLGLRRIRPAFQGVFELLRFAKWGWLQGVGGVLFGVADRMIVGSLLGAASLAYYSIATQLAMQVHAISAAGLSVIFPMVSRMLQSGESLSLQRIATFTAGGNLLLSSAVALLLLVLGPAFLSSWIGAEAAGPTADVLPWLVLAYWVLALNVVPYYILRGIGHIRSVGLTVVIAGMTGTIAMFISVTWLGLQGAPVGRGVYALVSLALVIPFARHLLLERNANRRPDAPTQFPAH